MRTNREAAAHLGQVFDRLGLRGAFGGRYVANEMQQRLGLHKAPDGPLSQQTKDFLELASRLCSNAQATNPQRAACLQAWLGLDQRPEARAAFEQLMGGVPNVFQELGPEHIRILAGQLASAPDFEGMARRVEAFKALLGHELFQIASPQGKTNALSEPERARKTIRFIRIPGSPEIRREALKDWAAHEGRGMKRDAISAFSALMEAKSQEIRQGHFEDHPLVKKMTGHSVWRGEALETEFGVYYTQKVRNYIMREGRAGARVSTNHSRNEGNLIFKDYIREHVDRVRVIPDNWPPR